MTTLFLDLDGVFADFDSHFQSLFDVPSADVDYEDMWPLIIENKTFFADLPTMDDAHELWDAVHHLDPVFLTACPKLDYERSALQKRAWVRKNFSQDAMVLPVLGGANKYLFMHKPGDVLIDDYKKNIEPWASNCGRGIVHTSAAQTISTLKMINVLT